MPTDTGSIADDMLRSGYERWLRLEEEKTALADDLKELFAELKAEGFDSKALRVSFRRVRDMNSAEVAEQEALVELYVASLTRDARDARESVDPLTGEILDTESRPADAPDATEAGEPSGDKARRQLEPLSVPSAAQEGGGPTIARMSSSGRTEPSADGHTVSTQEAGVEGEGQAGAESSVAAGNASQALLPSDRAENKPDAPAVIAGVPISSSRFVDDKPLRPHCLHPGPSCGGYGRNHCGICQRAAANATVTA